jgi:anaerobic ribonucleoside-triphosphate reductase activating protein
MRIAHLVADTEAEGPGRRFALWTQGCTLRCPGCCNPELFGAGGTEYTLSEIMAQITQTPGIEGISLLGGEPTEQPDLPTLCAAVQGAGLTVMLYSGHTLTTLRDTHPTLLQHVDLLVDGRFQATKPDHERRWIGSTNQQMHFLTDAYSHSDPRFKESNTVEIRLSSTGLVVNGWPAGARALHAKKARR